jgi:hypothetical protein
MPREQQSSGILEHTKLASVSSEEFKCNKKLVILIT